MSDYETPNLNIFSENGRNELVDESENSYESVEDILADFRTRKLPAVSDDDPTLRLDPAAAAPEPAEMQDDLTDEQVYPEPDYTEDSFVNDYTEDFEDDGAEAKRKGKKESASAEKKKSDKSGKKKKKRRKRHPFFRFLAFCAIVYGLYRFAMSSVFTVRNIAVEGNHYYTSSQVIEMAQIPTGYNLFTTDISTGKDILLADPYIEVVNIKREPFDTIRIVMTEREEYAALPYGTDYIIIDRNGLVLRVSDKEPALPLIVADKNKIIEMTPGKALVVEQSYLLTSTLELLSVMGENDLYFKRIDFSTVVVRAYIYDELYCEGTPDNITDSMSDIRSMVGALYNEGTTRGIIKVGKPGILSLDPQIE